ncbi:a9161de0-52bf-4a44-8092-87297326325c-CDS [Sclerotinia trifoliorum]|uniref:A9161de0-52bf-4a44-8092-87297326325c-CDS n=1 Tax=Sclerotinia trifoliorum TaxID=28548 RepID=A0A8H2W0Z3_9HELO|nr:a9161de0-52bf-4a44-8092-87297326325c-CDS [Sclerotinia trifoliorum]
MRLRDRSGILKFSSAPVSLPWYVVLLPFPISYSLFPRRNSICSSQHQFVWIPYILNPIIN